MSNQMKTIVLLGTLSAFVTGAVSLLAPGFWMPFAAVAVGLNLVMYYYSDRLVLRMQNATELHGADHPALHRMNEELAHAAGIPAPRLYLVNAPYANAFATGRGPGHAAIAVTQGLLDSLTRREIRGVTAH
jgi:heat shock protein HtpX